MMQNTVAETDIRQPRRKIPDEGNKKLVSKMYSDVELQ